MIRRPPRSTLFPYTPLSRSVRAQPLLARAGPLRKPMQARPQRPPRPRRAGGAAADARSEEHTSELQSQSNLVCRLLLEKKKNLESRIENTYTTMLHDKVLQS